MFSYKIEANENNQWTEVHGWVRPFTDGQTLDDSLDSGKINLSFVTRSAPYAPFTRIRISIYEEGIQDAVDVLQYVVDTDDVQCRCLAPSTKKLYDHSIALVELTKLLEREVCDTMTVTNYLGHEFAEEGGKTEGQREGGGSAALTGTPPTFPQWSSVGKTIEIPAASDYLTLPLITGTETSWISTPKTTVTTITGESQTFTSATSYTFDESGAITIVADCEWFLF